MGVGLGEALGPQAVLVDGDQLARLDLADLRGADDVQGGGLAGDDPAPVQPAEHQRADPCGSRAAYRLFDETKRLLAETDERAAELAVVNSVQRGLAENLDMQSMYELVGEKIREIFDAQVVTVAVYDQDAGTMRAPYAIERGVRFSDWEVDRPLSGIAQRLISTREPIVVNEGWAEFLDANGLSGVAIVGEPPKSVVFAPLVAGDQVRGAMSIQNVDREHAFSESDVRVLTTLAASLSVALENARLFDETRRLLAETDRRAAELAIINSVQEGLAAQLDVQAMYELVGERAQGCLRHPRGRHLHLRP